MTENKKMLGIMLDCSRCAVMTVEAVKRFIDCMKKMGYNTLMLHMEDTYEIPNEPFFGYLRGRYSGVELAEIDAYAMEHGVEVVPCIQTLAHLFNIFHWDEYKCIQDAADVILTDDARTMELIENMFRALRGCLKTNRIHIGMDEAPFLGMGEYMNRYGYRNRTDILLAHLDKVCKLAEKYGFEPMMWSDMFYRVACSGKYYEGNMSEESVEKVRAKIPKSLTLVYWDYYNENTETYRKMLRGHKQLSDKVTFAGGVWTWSGFVPLCDRALAVTEPGMAACRAEGVENIFVTAWGDNGSECSAFTALPQFLYAAEAYRGNTDLAIIKDKFFALFGENFDELCALGDMNKAEYLAEQGSASPSKALLYSDILLGIYDKAADAKANAYYAELAEKYQAYAAKSKMFSIHFTCIALLAELLSLKIGIGGDLRSAYQIGDRVTLTDIAERRIPAVIAAEERFLEAFRTEWYAEKKPHGFDVHELRIGGIISRAKSAAKRISEYLAGETDRIDELELEILPVRLDGMWRMAASVNLEI